MLAPPGRYVKYGFVREAIRKHDLLTGVALRHLAAFEVVADLRSFHAAARVLGYSQSAVSQQIAALERAAGTRLLERPVGTRRVALTEAGDRLLRHARRAIAALRAAEADLAALTEGGAGTLRVGTYQSASARLLPPVLREFVQQRPMVQVSLMEAAYDNVLRDALLRGEIELTFLFEFDDPAFVTLPLLTDPFVLLAPAETALPGEGRPLSLREVARLRLIGYGRPEESGEVHLVRRGLAAEVVFRSDEMAAVQALVGAGLGCAVVPLLTVRPDDPLVQVRNVAEVPPREIVLAWLADRTLSPGAKAFVEVATAVAERWRAA